MAARIPRALRIYSTRTITLRSFYTGDPFLLPLSKEVTERLGEKETPLPPRIQRNNETTNALRARLVYQSRKRGMLEGDLLLSTFASEHLPTMSENELQEYDRLLDEPDWDIYYWVIQKKEPPERWVDSKLLEKLRVHARNEGKVVRKMPDLSLETPLP
ncbi:succinate dehydrogenase assembly factor 2 [Serendipita sp. 401]|nr:succinate dehydrogenase assembly factor 2 [Serendipita sp. 401]